MRTTTTMRDGEHRTYGDIRMVCRLGLGIIPLDSIYFEDQRPRFRSWAAAEDWAWAVTTSEREGQALIRAESEGM